VVVLAGFIFSLILSAWIPLLFIRPLPIVGYLFLAVPAAVSIFVIGQFPLAINHYRAARGRLLVISAGKSEFLYGPSALPRSYDKRQILEMVTYGMSGRGGGYNWLTRVKINFKDGTSINLSGLVISRSTLMGKLPGCPQEEKTVLFPFIPLSALTPS
jgi:hypothetical protein